MKQLEKKLENLKNRQKQLSAQIKETEAMVKLQERKARAHRLIELGGSVESVIGQVNHEQLPILITILKELHASGAFTDLYPDPDGISLPKGYTNDLFFEEDCNNEKVNR